MNNSSHSQLSPHVRRLLAHIQLKNGDHSADSQQVVIVQFQRMCGLTKGDLSSKGLLIFVFANLSNYLHYLHVT